MARVDPIKAKTAKRVIEVFEYFDDQKRHATVMDIVRRYKRPQSSTSELMASLVQMGLLYKDPVSRSYTPTPRAAVLGALAQPNVVRDGRLWSMIERLAAETGHGVALLGMVGLDVQIFHSMPGKSPATSNFHGGGRQDRMVDCAAGFLLLSTLPSDRRDGVLRRLNAEAPTERKFNHSDMRERAEACGKQGFSVGEAGFGGAAHMCSVLLEVEPGNRPLALAFIYDRATEADAAALLARLQQAVRECSAIASEAAGQTRSSTV